MTDAINNSKKSSTILLTEEEYAKFKQLICQHQRPEDAIQCYCCGGYHYWHCAKCGLEQGSDDCHDRDDPDYPYCGSCI